MLRTVVRLTPTFMFPIFGKERNPMDQVDVNRGIGHKTSETGLDRVKEMFRRNEYGEFSVEFHTVAQSSMCGAFLGAILGGFIHSRSAYVNFIENNQATIFKSTRDAQKKLQEKVTLAFASGAYKWGWKVALFTGTFSLISTVISVYSGETAVLEYTIAGALTGALFKANLGIAATCVGAGVGAVLSTIGGFLIIGILKVAGVTMNDIRAALYKVKEAREQQLNEAMAKASDMRNDPLTMHHDMIVEETGQNVVDDL